MSRQIIVGSRASQLALLQARLVISELKEVAPALEFTIEKISTTGDRDRNASLSQIGGQGVFVKELEVAMLAGKIDIAVHSLKDVPTELSSGLKLAAVTTRQDARDIIISKSGKKLNDLPSGAVIGTGSQRRAVQLHQLRPDIKTSDLRGNIDTRIRKAHSKELDGVLLAAAALIRLELQDKITEYLPMQDFIPAVGQGAIGIEIRQEDNQLSDLVTLINHTSTWERVIAERSFLRHLGGGCQAPIAAHATINNSIMQMFGLVASTDGTKVLRSFMEGPSDYPEKLGTLLAQEILDMGAHDFIDKV